MSYFDHGLVAGLPKADLGIDGLKVYISHSDNHEVWFLETETEINYPPHTHCAQWSSVLAGEITITMDGKNETFKAGEQYAIPSGVEHEVKMSTGYAEILVLDDPNILGL